MSTPQSLPLAGRVYVGAVIAAGTVVLAWSVRDVVQLQGPDVWPVLVLLALTSFSSTFSIKIPNVSLTISVSETFVFICALLFGPAPATLIIALDGLIISCWRRHWRPHQALFNATAPALSLFVAAHVFFWFSGLPYADRRNYPIDVGSNLLPLVAFTSMYFLLATGVHAIVISLQLRTRLRVVWRQHFGWVLLNYFGATSVAALLVHNAREFNFTALGIVVPLLVISYLTFKISMGRVEDANRHLQELNKLYISTIETLAMAVDAKDQITHGHIRRVQAFAIGLARSLGITDEEQLKAIEAAALLHDMGKLAIPEHILNKPGKLSSAEFEKMKKHASIGADILSAIDFPYPVVPIVRHHHEQWDGGGYPQGLKGADIPIGARILSVVDCFDALTSDRPYRRALKDEEALQLLLEQRGTAYDPLVVDKFAAVYRDIVPRELEFGPHRKALDQIAEIAHRDVEPPEQPAALEVPAGQGADPQLLPIFESLHAFSAQTVLTDAAEEIARKLQALTPATLCALYLQEPHTTELTVAHATGDLSAHLRGVHFPIGERLSGWVAANRRTICNSDAQLDLGDLSNPPPVVFRSCLSTPLVAGDSLVGVLSLYAVETQAFSDSHRRIVEHTARPLAHLVRGSLELEKVQRATSAGALSHLPSAGVVELDLLEEPCLCPVAAVSLQVHGPAQDEQGATLGMPELLLARAAALLRRDLRVADLLYRDGQHGLLAVLPHADAHAAQRIAFRARENLTAALEALDPTSAVNLRILTGIGTAPADGLLLDDVMSAARRRASAAEFTVVESSGVLQAQAPDGPRQPGLFDEESVVVVNPWRRAS